MAEGPGAELSICYQKVSGRDAVRRWPEVPLEGGRCQGHGGQQAADKGTFCPSLDTAPSFPTSRAFCRDGGGL